jgi:hypothetical protein
MATFGRANGLPVLDILYSVLISDKVWRTSITPHRSDTPVQNYVLEDEESWGSAGGDAANLATVFSAVKERVEVLPTEEEQSNSMAGGSKYQV